ncbi:putative glycoside hydrolase [Candidatus Contubernalis alkaliaceticus]|uniref:putative glycoside hydrolase n=1 Tax=Candidatus Contubernalis alkaliaceticus TaxID=338645 RepID=UPI001F4C0BD8|nr:putative glycoside hydrolase [Candidatus Contubernalis alkalaceticus]
MKYVPVGKGHKAILISILVIAIFIPFCLQGCSLSTETGTEDFQSEDVKEGEGVVQEEDPEEERLRVEEEERELQKKLEEERKLREEALRVDLGHFFVPLPPLEQEDNPPVKAKGIYVTGNSVGLTSRFERLLDMVAATELNAMVIDVKNDHGLMTYRSEIDILIQSGANKSAPVKDMQEVVAMLKEKGIYTIARVVVFRDPLLPEFKPEWAIQKNQGGVWRDNKGMGWVNPYNKNVWDYNIAIAKEAALMGFQEIQFDYVRFPENAHRVDREAYYPGEDGKPKDKAIQDFLTYAQKQLEEYNVYIAADVFGVIATSWGDTDKIGQTWEKIAPLVDYNCPMIYPSHYGSGYFGFDVPDAHPAGTVTHALNDAIKRNAHMENPGIIRPWLQSFTASWIRGNIPYGPQEVRAQIDAALELGIDEYLIWNAGNRYQPDAFLSPEEALINEEKIKSDREQKGHDVLGHTAEKALEEYLESVRRKDWREAMVYQSTGFSYDHHQFREWVGQWTGRLTSYDIIARDNLSEGKVFSLDFTITIDGNELITKGKNFEVYKENMIWRVKPPTEFIETLAFIPEATMEEEQDTNN